ncbi:MAG TPA: PP2C family protein-serine/threonine phosphatase, partial [Thermoanaerobaculia bacterium]|nr:PP2C family protein-serine/threonine phosphatase [Thermoanaerobaculia bacterium]
LLPDWSVTRDEAQKIALARVGVLGDLPEDPYVVTRLDSQESVDFRLMMERDPSLADRVAASELVSWIANWDVYVYAPKRRSQEWTYHARVAPDGRVLDLVMRLPREEAGAAIAAADARERADRFLAEQGFDLARFEAPEIKIQDQVARTDTTVRYRFREQLLGERLAYGYEVHFAGEQLGGFETWWEDPKPAEVAALLQPFTLAGNLQFFMLFLVLPVVGIYFVRRYHEGVVGIDRSLRIFLLCLGAIVLLLPMVARGATQNWNWGPLTREQTTFMWMAQMLLVFFLPQALVSALSWSAGESLCRERWGAKLAAFDALLRRDWRNRTVAIASLRGLSLGALLAALLLLPTFVLPESLGRPAASIQLGGWWPSAPWPGLALVLSTLIFTLYYELFGRLFLVPLLTQKLGIWVGGLAAAIVAGLVFWAPLGMLPWGTSIPVSIFYSGFLVVAFLRWDFLTSSIASFTSQVMLSAMPFVLAESPRLQIAGWVGILAGAIPALVSLRDLGSEREFVYKYEDIPPHVRRIAERERQRVELETARNIQSSILPQLPAQLNGVEIAHTYLPATEVGGDFYDVMALEDGRLAVAVGDVAGHGVSSGLVMSMAKSALAVQVTFDPEVEGVFRTLNRMVFQSARKRLLTTLCYALLDPKRRELQFASAGHLFPYRVTPGGRVEMLESISYPLGVRPTIEVVSHTAKLDPGDLIFLCSDGLVEARREGSDEHFGFERVEQALARAAGNGAGVVRDAMLAELREFTGDAPREDDLTLLVLRLPD